MVHSSCLCISSVLQLNIETLHGTRDLALSSEKCFGRGLLLLRNPRLKKSFFRRALGICKKSVAWF